MCIQVKLTTNGQCMRACVILSNVLVSLKRRAFQRVNSSDNIQHTVRTFFDIQVLVETVEFRTLRSWLLQRIQDRD